MSIRLSDTVLHLPDDQLPDAPKGANYALIIDQKYRLDPAQSLICTLEEAREWHTRVAGANDLNEIRLCYLKLTPEERLWLSA
jgi:hypothetical protein